MEMNEIVIDRSKSSKYCASGTKVFLNGEELHGVVNVKSEIGVDTIPMVTLEIYGNLEIIPPEKEL